MTIVSWPSSDAWNCWPGPTPAGTVNAKVCIIGLVPGAASSGLTKEPFGAEDELMARASLSLRAYLAGATLLEPNAAADPVLPVHGHVGVPLVCHTGLEPRPQAES
eukprot:scaffold113826_cov55-Phaeocystis_antarctica.AAC.1